MSRKFTPALVASIIGTTVLTPVALGQTAAEYATQGENCLALETLAAEQTDRLQPEWVQQSRTVIQTADEAQCLVAYEEATAALDQTGDVDAAASAAIVVTQPDPEVDVETQAPEVSVSDPEAQVDVDQGQPEVVVEQASPDIGVEVPQPSISIDQPQPEITVRMPDPDIAVTDEEPQIEVNQAEPQIEVQQGEPEIALEAQQATSGEAEIEVQQQDAQVEVEPSGEANVEVTQGEPVIRYEEAEPNIEVETQGEPQIEFNQSGEADVTIENAGATTEAVAPQVEIDVNALLLEDQPMEAGELMAYNVVDIAGQQIFNARGEELGTVDRVVSSGDRYYVVLTGGGFLGYGEREVALPLDVISINDGALVMRGMTQEDIDAIREFDVMAAQEVGTDQQVEIGTL